MGYFILFMDFLLYTILVLLSMNLVLYTSLLMIQPRTLSSNSYPCTWVWALYFATKGYKG